MLPSASSDNSVVLSGAVSGSLIIITVLLLFFNPRE